MGRLLRYLPMIIAGVKWVRNRRQERAVRASTAR
jgi:hypothetical protein